MTSTDWTNDPRWGDDDARGGTLDELRALLARRIEEVEGPLGEALDGQVFRFYRELNRLVPFMPGLGPEDDPSEHAEYQDGDGALNERVNALLGEDWPEKLTTLEDEERGEDAFDRIVFSISNDASAAAVAHPWIARGRFATLDELSAVRSPGATKYRVAELWPSNGKVILSAPAKAGKTTLIANVLRSLDVGDPLFGCYAVEPLAVGEVVALVDFELNAGMVEDWLREQGIKSDRVRIATMRGQGWDPRDPDTRREWARDLRAMRAKVLIVDPLGPILRANRLPETNEAIGQILHALDMLTLEAGIRELLVVHHFGHEGERSRGGVVLRDWPDAEWRLLKQRTPRGEEAPPDAPRYFAADGRDVAVPETALAYDRETRHLGLGEGNRHSTATEGRAKVVVEILTATPGLVTNALREALHGRGITATAEQTKAITAAKGGPSPMVHTHDGPKNAKIHFLGSECGPQCVSGTSNTSGTSRPTSTTVSSSTTTLLGSTAHTRLVEGNDQDRSSSTTHARSLRVGAA